MKRIITILVATVLSVSVFAQSPEKISYQAVIRNSSNNLVVNTAIGMQITILQETVDGTAVYTEVRTPTTNSNGVVSVEIGTGTTSDDLSSIDWANGPYFIKTETDIEGGANYNISGTSQLLSVPFALFSNEAGSLSKESSAYLRLEQLESLLIEKGIYNSVSDVDGNEYKIVKIGTQVWMAENLRTTKLNDGTPINNVSDPNDWTYYPTNTQYRWYDDDEDSYKEPNGALYNWPCIESGNLCPSGWHVPSKEEWDILIEYAGGADVAGGKLKGVGETYFETNIGATDEFGFNALPGGNTSYDIFWHIRSVAYYGTSTENQDESSSMYSIRINGGQIYLVNEISAKTGNSIRCIKD